VPEFDFNSTIFFARFRGFNEMKNEIIKNENHLCCIEKLINKTFEIRRCEQVEIRSVSGKNEHSGNSKYRKK